MSRVCNETGHKCKFDGVSANCCADWTETETPKPPVWSCKARGANMGANDPQDCDWPLCGCDPYANRVIEALEDGGFAVRRNARLISAAPDLLDALCGLCAEVGGALGIAREDIRRSIGNTNVACIERRLKDAEAAIARQGRARSMK